ncbi:sodium:alanine symporter family protein [Acetivibrio sp. MSJd-27]|uniref:alanine/glycine:cation symporter family protein n=1 Tax=Acetivibrio sp. MSJd-27 TaxID=2841523 RepID=UPI001C0FC611|nr:sodium:alanine symporter family protein [Acetivibrio sp. MSJd-27]MBU5450044.1 sodium:alanine symporter family protein [Acetivibrio sp. MSJd-27]
MGTLLEIVKNINSVLWNSILLFVLLGTGFYFTFKLRFIQVRKLKDSFRLTFGNIKLKGGKAGKDGMSSFQSLATAIASQVGTGNLAGAATAIASGGPGAVFWMWLSAFFGMATNYAEATLGQKFKTKDEEGHVVGGPVYYITQGIQSKFGKFLAVCFALFIAVGLGLFGNMVQSNSIGAVYANTFHIPPAVIGVITAIIALIVILGGVKRVASVTEKIVPVMAVVYLLCALVIIFSNIIRVPDAFRQIFVCAFQPQAMMSGAAGITVKEAMRYGFARGLFSNEAGMGTTPHAHALAKVEHPAKQGTIAMMGVFFDTFVILTITSLVLILTNPFSSGETGIALTQLAFHQVFPHLGNLIITVCLTFFAFSTIIAWYFFAEVNVRYLFGRKAVAVYAVTVAVFIVIGATLDGGLVWELSDMFNGLMVIPNVIGLLALRKVVSALSRDYDEINSGNGK